MSVFDPPMYLEVERGNWLGEGLVWQICLVKNGQRSCIDGLSLRDKDQVVSLFSAVGIEVKEDDRGQVEKPRWLR